MATYRLLSKGTINAVTLVRKLFAPDRSVYAASSIRRGFTTYSAQPSDCEDFNRSVDEDCRRGNCHFSQGMAPSGGGGSGSLGWVGKANKESIIFRFEMPAGLDKDDVKVSVEENTLIVKAEESVKEEYYSNRFVLPEHLFKVKEVNAEMRNGVLKVVLPKVITEERNYQGALGWGARANKESIVLRFDGLDKVDNVNVTVEENTLIIKAESEEKPPRQTRLVLPVDLFKLNEIKAEMKNGVLKVVLPMVITEERKDVWEVEVK